MKTLTLVFSFFLTSSAELKAQNESSPDLLFKTASQIVEQIKNRAEGITMPQVTVQTLYDGGNNKKTKVTVYDSNHFVRILSYGLYNEDQKPDGTESYYFDSLGRLVCHMNKSSGELSYDVYVDGLLVVYYDRGDARNFVLGSKPSLFQYAAAKYIVDYYLSGIPGLNYSTFDISKNREFSLQLISSVKLRKSPAAGSPVIIPLKKGEHVFYLDCSKNSDEMDRKEKWVWYKVKTKAGQTGWVWGHPSIIREVNEE